MSTSERYKIEERAVLMTEDRLIPVICELQQRLAHCSIENQRLQAALNTLLQIHSLSWNAAQLSNSKNV